MKRNNLFSLINILFSVVFFASCQFITDSCNRPVHEYFESYIDDVAIMYHKFDASLPKDKDGIYCIPSGRDRTITLYLRNAKDYKLDLGILALDSDASGYSIIQKATDRSVLIIKLPNDYLKATEGGKEFSPTITIRDSATEREFNSYQFNVRINSVPPEISDAIVMLDEENHYVLCFNLAGKKIVGNVHKDIVSVSINGKEFSLTVSNDDEICSSNRDLRESVADVILKSNSNGSNLSFPSVDTKAADYDGIKKSFYYFTNDRINEEDTVYKIVLKDKMGLTSSRTTSVYAEKLSSPIIYEGDKVTKVKLSKESVELHELSSGGDGSFKVWLKAPSGTEKNTPVRNVFVKYTVYSVDGTEEISSGKITQGTYINIPLSGAKIVCNSTMDTYIDSDNVTAYVKPLRTIP